MNRYVKFVGILLILKLTDKILTSKIQIYETTEKICCHLCYKTFTRKTDLERYIKNVNGRLISWDDRY
jgi:hypothetical protein